MKTAPLRLLVVVGLTVFVALRLMGWLGHESEPKSKRVGTGRVAGVVMDDLGRPLPGAHVFITEEDAQIPWTATAGADGTFEIERLPAGTFKLGAAKDGHLAAYFVQPLPRWGVTKITLADGAALSDFEIRVPRTASVAGRVLEADGTPMSDHEVRLRAIGRATGEAIVSGTVGVARTDASGRYRVDHLDAGDYVVVVRPRAQQRSVLYYPDARSQSGARTITLARGEQRADLDIHASAAPTSTIEGRVVYAGGPPPSRLDVLVFDADGRLPIGEDRTVETDAAGKFTIAKMPAGRFVLIAQTPLRPDAAARPRDASQTVRLSAEVIVTSDGRRPLETTLHLAPGVPVSGRLVHPHEGAISDGVITVRLAGDDARSRARLGFGGAEATVNADGSFTMLYVPPGRFTFVVSDRVVESVAIAARDITPAPIQVASTEIRDVTVQVSERAAEISGTLRDERGAASGKGVVILFPEDTRLWADWLSRVRVARPDSAGRFRFDHLGAGRYLAAGVVDARYGAWDEPAFLERLRSSSTTIDLGEAGQQTLELTALQTFNKTARQ